MNSNPILFLKLLQTHFNLQEIRTLCFCTNIRYENLSGDTLEDKTRELIEYASRNGKLELLRLECKRSKPHIDWDNLAHYAGTQPYTIEVLSVIDKLLAQKLFDKAIKLLREALAHDGDQPILHLYLSIALLNGEMPRLQKIATIKSIESLLLTCIRIKPAYDAAYLLLSIVKQDYYIANGMFESSPKINDLLSMVKGNLTNRELMCLTRFVTAPSSSVWKYLCNQY